MISKDLSKQNSTVTSCSQTGIKPEGSEELKLKKRDLNHSVSYTEFILLVVIFVCSLVYLYLIYLSFPNLEA